MTDLARALSVLADARQLVSLVDAARADAAHWRSMYRACYGAACEHIKRSERRWDTIEAQRDQMRETRRIMWMACMLACCAPAMAAELARGTEGQS